MKRFNKRGQVFLVAAVIIVGLIFGASRTLNYVSAGSNQEAFYDLTEALDFEVERVLDYGVVNSQDAPALAQTFLDEYTENVVNEEVVYIFGEPGSDTLAVHYKVDQTLEAISLAMNGGTIVFPIQHITQTEANVTQVNVDTVKVRVRDIDYVFNLRPGQNFYFIITKDDNEQNFVSVG